MECSRPARPDAENINDKRCKMYFIVVGLLVVAAFLVSLRVGRYPISIGEIASLLTGGEVGSTTRAVFLTLRLPRTMTALLAGAGLGLSGSVFQQIFRNPLAAPDIVGVTSGANLGAAFAVIMFGHSATLMAGTAFVGAMASMLLVVAIAKLAKGGSTVAFILAGIIMRAIADALIMMLKYYADPEKELAAIEYWAMGSLSGITASKLLAVVPFFLLGLFGIILLRRQIALLGLEDDESRTLGVSVRYVRVAVLGFSALTVASIICITGPIAFTGLIAPHVARLALKRISFLWCILSAMTGAFILLVSDCLARGISSAEIPVSIPTTLIGVPILLYFMWMRKTVKI